MAADNSEATRLVRLCSSSLAAFFTVLFMVHAVHKKAYKDFAKRVTMALVLGNLLHAIVDLLGLAFNNSLLCTIYGIVRSWALLSTATWSVVLAVHIFLLLRYNRSIRTRERWIQLACWSLPIPAALVPLSDSSSFGEAGLWCVTLHCPLQAGPPGGPRDQAAPPKALAFILHGAPRGAPASSGAL